MTSDKKPRTSRRVRFGILLFPPVGLLLLWLDRTIPLRKKLARSVFTLLYGVVYVGLVIGILHQWFGLKDEWRGGRVPAFTWKKTQPDYDELEASRRAQAALSPQPTNQASVEWAAYWTGFRGPLRDGHYANGVISTNWPATGLRALWRQPCGGGYASFAIANGLAYTIEQRRKQEAVIAYELQTGREVWVHAYDALFEEWQGGDGPRATPAYDDGRLYSLGGLGDLHCLEAATGALIWTKNLVIDNESKLLRYGFAASPLIVDGMVIVLAGGPGKHTVVAYDQLTGNPVWQSLTEKQAYSSPMLVTLAGQRQLLVVTGARAVGLRVEDGGLLWGYDFPVSYGNSIAQPLLLSTNSFLLAAGYGVGCAKVEVERTQEGFSTRTLWRNKHLRNKFSSSVFWAGYIYGLDEDALVCLDAATGERRWKGGRYGYGQLLLASGHLVILCGDGDLALVKAAPERPTELARVPGLSGKTWNHPAISEGRLLVRNAAEMACFDLGGR